MRHTVTTAIMFVIAGLALTGCSTEKVRLKAMETAAKHWQDKAYPGKGHDVQVLTAEKGEGDTWRVKGRVDREEREGTYYPETDTFSEGYYPLQKEKGRRVAELEQEVRYWKDKADELEKENYRLKVRLGIDPDSKKKAPAAPAEEQDAQ